MNEMKVYRVEGLTTQDTLPYVAIGTKKPHPSYSNRTLIYLQVMSSTIATQAAKSTFTEGRPGVLFQEDGKAAAYTPTAADALTYNRPMVVALFTVSANKYAWFYCGPGYVPLAKHDKNQVTDGDRIVFKIGTASYNQINNIGIASFTGTTARIQGWIDSNSATNKSATGDNNLKIFLYGF